MGLTHVAVTVRNRDSKDSFSANFLVDTGAMDSLVPAYQLKRIGVQPSANKPYELANGEIHRYDVAWVELSVMDETISSRVIFGPDNAEPILGVMALEAVGLVVDPTQQKLKRLRALPLKRSA